MISKNGNDPAFPSVFSDDDYEMERINSAYAALTQQEQGK